MSNSITLLLRNVRASYPKIDTPGEPQNGAAVGKYGVTGLLDRDEHAADIKAIRKFAKRMFEEKNDGRSFGAEKKGLRDGDGEDCKNPEYAGFEYLVANNKNAPVFINNKGSAAPVAEARGVVYGGCYVNMKVEIYYHDHKKGGKRLDASLLAIQFAGHGDAFGGSVISDEEAEEGFGAVETDNSGMIDDDEDLDLD